MSYKIKQKNIVRLEQFLKKKINGLVYNSDGKNKGNLQKK
tara:strand:+ start:6797 stop:6916 length:120 start_codon:yes stop_codon:yes gene_type:complete